MTYYHGSSKKNIHTLQPKQPRDRGPKAVYLSKEIFGPEVYALVKRGGQNIGINYITENHSRRFGGGVIVSKGPLSLANKGYIYKAKSRKGIVQNPKASNHEYISMDPVHVAFHKEVTRQEVLGRGWKVYENQRFPNLKAAWEIIKTARKK